jgi:hypothetical protein
MSNLQISMEESGRDDKKRGKKSQSKERVEVICSIQLMSQQSSKRPANIQLWYKPRGKP